MEFCIQLSAYYPDKDYGGDRIYADMLEQARTADRCGYDSVAITEHHLINILMMPAPLQFAVKLAAETQNVQIITAVSVLPLHDMRILAGEIVCADIFTDHRLILGVGRGAFTFEMDRLGVPLAISREKFDESLEVLQALLSREEVAWEGDYYRFEALTIMPRPASEIPLALAVMAPEAIYHCTRRGFHILTTPLSGDHQLMREQVDAFVRGKQDRGVAGARQTLSLSRVSFLARDDADCRRKLELAHDYYGRFDNVFTGPGLVDAGMIRPLPREMTLAQTAENLTIATTNEMVDKLAPYAEAGVDRFIMNVNFGAKQAETLESIERFAADVMPHFAGAPAARAGRAG